MLILFNFVRIRVAHQLHVIHSKLNFTFESLTSIWIFVSQIILNYHPFSMHGQIIRHPKPLHLCSKIFVFDVKKFFVTNIAVSAIHDFVFILQKYKLLQMLMNCINLLIKILIFSFQSFEYTG